MKKLKLILTAFALLLGWSNAWADEVIDITSKRLTNANLSSLTGWTFDDSFSAEGNDYTDYKTDGDVNVVEFYSEWAGTPGAMASSKNFKMTQTVTLSAGTYRLSAYGFYREKNGDGTNIKAYLKAGTNQSYINGLSSDGLSGYTGSNDLYKAANAFSRGDFNNTLEFTLDSKQNIEVGIVGTFNTQCSWCIVGPMSLVKVLEGGIELTEVIINPSFETGDMTGWSALREGVVVDPTSLSDCKVHTIESHPLTNADGEYLMNYYGWSWSWNANANGIEQTIPNMPAGNYRITAVLGGWAPTTAEGFSEPAPWEMTLKVNDVEQNKEMVTDDAGVSFSVDITLASATDLTITATTIHKGQNKWEACFMKADNFRIFNLDNYYDALNEAIAYAEDNYPLGFDNGEYAPYNNVDAIGYLKAAKDVNQGGYIDWDELQTIVSNLKSATWTANVGEVNAFAYGDFSTYQTISGKDYPYGWQLNNGTDGNNSRIMGGTEGSGNAGLAASSTGKALLLKWNASYGETQGYTMPLNASTLYKITFTYCGWGGNSPHTNIVMTDPNSNNITLNPAFEPIGSHGESYTSDWTIFTGYFVSTTAGNYTFNLNKQEGGQQQIAIADIELKSSNDALDFADGSVRPTYAPGTYPSVKVTRSLAKDRWATAIYPFAVTAAGAGVEVATLASFTDGALGFSTSDGTSVANKPFLMRASSAKDDFTLSSVAVAAASATAATSGKAEFRGVYSETTVSEEDDFAKYVLSQNTIYKIESTSAIVAPYRGYFAIDTSAGAKALRFVVDGQATNVDAPEVAETEEEEVLYNMAGVRVDKNFKGFVINQKGEKRFNK